MGFRQVQGEGRHLFDSGQRVRHQGQRQLEGAVGDTSAILAREGVLRGARAQAVQQRRAAVGPGEKRKGPISVHLYTGGRELGQLHQRRRVVFLLGLEIDD